uniref:Uncharacterized protein n=1 Tax=Rhizophora mucronata TaxID=61149 RepID=A0A2P2IXW8_RHIMU
MNQPMCSQKGIRPKSQMKPRSLFGLQK